MKKKSVFIVDASLNYINELSNQLAKEDDIFVVGYALNGSDALQRIKMLQELDVLIIDMLLPVKDGIQVLKEIKSNKKEFPEIKLILCQSSIINDHIISLISNLGGHQVIQKPSSYLTIKTHIDNLEFVNDQNKAKQQAPINKRITRILHNVGIPAHIKGYHFLREAIELTINNPSVIGQVTKSLYPMLAEKFDSSTSKVERAIRHAIELGWNRGNPDTIDSIFGYTISASRAKPTNSEFIAMVSDYISLGEDIELTQTAILKQKIMY
ncbi:MAG: sporulation transcription factor Spo0A [Erysipelotrichaceae bacterium]|nr:sporulation transcription factor Spo0A [Erysipelotrichaceae bacterium]